MRKDSVLFSIEDIIKLQLEGLEASCNKAEILCLTGCMNLIEFMGGILNGKLGVRGCELIRFKEGVRFLGGKYADLKILGETRMWQLRCAITHQYVPTISDTAMINIGRIIVINHPEKRPKEILKDIQDLNRFILAIELSDLVSTLKEASSKLTAKLKEDKDMRDTANTQFNKLSALTTRRRMGLIVRQELKKLVKE